MGSRSVNGQTACSGISRLPGTEFRRAACRASPTNPGCCIVCNIEMERYANSGRFTPLAGERSTNQALMSLAETVYLGRRLQGRFRSSAISKPGQPRNVQVRSRAELRLL